MTFRFTREARSQLRAIDRGSALRILEAIDRFGSAGSGDVEPLTGEWQGCYRLRIGDYRAIFGYAWGGIEVLAVGHRSDVYR